MLTTLYRSFHNSCAIETGLSDFRKMIVTVMKLHFQNKVPKIIQCRNYNDSSAEEYRQYIISLLSSLKLTRSGFDTFMTICKDDFDNGVPIKNKNVRSNNSFFINKKISKALMNRTRLRNRFLRTRCNGDKEASNK